MLDERTPIQKKYFGVKYSHVESSEDEDRRIVHATKKVSITIAVVLSVMALLAAAFCKINASVDSVEAVQDKEPKPSYLEAMEVCKEHCHIQATGEMVCSYDLVATAMFLDRHGLHELESEAHSPYRIWLVYNQQSPGPLICLQQNARALIRVHNKLEYKEQGKETERPDLTTHWHGMFVRGSCDSDGVPGITEHGILFGDSRLYNFTVTREFGASWYHSHANLQYADGLFGPLFILPNDYVSSLSHLSSLTLLTINGVASNFSTEVYQAWADGNANLYASIDSLAMGGNVKLKHYRKMQPEVCEGGQVEDYMVFHVPPCLVEGAACPKGIIFYINAGAIVSHAVSIQHHSGTVISADAPYVISLSGNKTSIVTLLVGQRYGVEYTWDPPNNGQYDYWIGAMADFGPSIFGCAILHYDYPGAPVAVPPGRFDLTEFQGADCNSASDQVCCSEATCLATHVNLEKERSCLKPTTQPKKPLDPTGLNRCDVLVTVTLLRPPVQRWLIALDTNCHYPDGSQTSVKSPPTAYHKQHGQVLLEVAVREGRDPKDTSWVQKYNFTNVVVIPAGFQVFVTIHADYKAKEKSRHPWHQHGYDLLWLGGSTFQKKIDPQKLNYQDPISRDTVLLNSQAFSVYSFKADNPGVWFSHCHLEGHLTRGFAVVWVTAPENLLSYAIRTT
eukprot:gb/GEZN01002121.1/.p1 GENE.gb/GEZN01002121.1/~~gb/GEZN01002121.1/.p1  ORF type:complete len:676 (+),score=49.23 gb/GEZN01002121.1/:40-2067(+)